MTKGQRIKKRRDELNIKQTELAKKVHISKQTLYKYENDIITNIPSNKLEDIAAALDTTPDCLMGWEQQDKAKELYSLYEKASPEVQSAVELLLKSSQPSAESQEKT